MGASPASMNPATYPVQYLQNPKPAPALPQAAAELRQRRASRCCPASPRALPTNYHRAAGVAPRATANSKFLVIRIGGIVPMGTIVYWEVLAPQCQKIAQW